MPHILLTNDDGIQAEGLRVLAAALEGFATVSIVAPSREQSGTAQSLTLRQPIICNPVAEREWAVDGTPADCVIVALHKLLTEKPDLVISGINHGANLGENAYYSGTARGRPAPYAGAGHVALFQSAKSQLRTRGASGAPSRGIDFERRIA
jgi:5'-nucleotidase